MRIIFGGNSSRLQRLTKRLYILVETFFQQRDFERYGIEILQAGGYEVEIWEVFRPFRRAYAETFRPPDPARFHGLKHFQTMAEVISALHMVRPEDTVIAQLSHDYATAPIFRALTRRGAYFGRLLLGGFDTTPTRGKRLWRLGSLKLWLDRLYIRIPHAIKKTRRFRFFILCGGTALESAAGRVSDSELIWAHALDYDVVLRLQSQHPERTRDHIVFLDEFLPFHPDYVMTATRPPNTAEEYYPRLAELFNGLERHVGRPVVIAAHPRSDYHARPDYFGGRKVIQGQTAQLVSRSALVVTHSSVSNNYTVAFKKPVLAVTTNGIRNSCFGSYVEATAAAFRAPLLNLDERYDLGRLNLAVVDETYYEILLHAHVKRPGTPERNTWAIVADHWREHSHE